MKNKPGIFNKCIRSGTFPEMLKKAEVTPVFKKGDPTSKTDYRPVYSIKFFKTFWETHSLAIINNYMQDKFLIYLTGSWKNHDTQHAVLKMIEAWKRKQN